VSFDVDLVIASKLISLAIFFPIYVGACVYAAWKPNQQRFDHMAALPLRED
jgi:hypothetical protein